MIELTRLWDILQTVRRETPLVHHITNLVVTNFTANATLAMGASPVMSHSIDEVQEMVSAARALVLNIGTLDARQIEAMIAAGREANRLGVPVVLDPVGVGATELRTRSVIEIMSEVEVDILRGNTSEIAIVGGTDSAIRGVDAVGESADVARLARGVAAEMGCVVAATGPEDAVSDGRRTYRIQNGHPLMGAVTGTGCVATSVVAACDAVADDPVRAAVAGLSYLGCAAERASVSAEGPGSFAVHLLDELYGTTCEDYRAAARIVADGGG
ncbi:MAG: hydroxyethylthiazole kinase [Clostridia bacterium]